jgi:hypothetical protein
VRAGIHVDNLVHFTLAASSKRFELFDSDHLVFFPLG